MFKWIEPALIKILEKLPVIFRTTTNPTVHKDDLLVSKVNQLYKPELKEEMYLSVSERKQHTYILGATATGKSHLIEFMLRGDIDSEQGFCLIDPHGDLYENILGFIAKKLNALP